MRNKADVNFTSLLRVFLSSHSYILQNLSRNSSNTHDVGTYRRVYSNRTIEATLFKHLNIERAASFLYIIPQAFYFI